MPDPGSVKLLYRIWVHTYDPLRELWMRIASKRPEEELISFLRKNVDGASVLELGGGTGINIGRIIDTGKRFRQYLGLDFSDDMLAVSRRRYGGYANVEIRKQDLSKRPKLGKFDIIISTWVLSHFDQPSKIVNYYRRNLKKGGTMVLIFLSDPVWYIRFWFYPIQWLCASRPVCAKEIALMGGKKEVRRTAKGLSTIVWIRG